MPALIWLAMLTVAMATPAAFADSLCPGDKEAKQAEAQLSQAEKSEQAGNARAAYAGLQKVDSDCLSSASDKRRDAMRKRLGKRLGDEDEKNGRLKEAFDWFEGSGNKADAARVMLKRAQARPDDRSTFGAAFDYFKNRGPADSLKTLRSLAGQNARQLLATEEKQFAADRDSLDALGKARDWLYYTEAPENRLAVERAEKRGDTLAAESTRHFLNLAVSYYEFAGKPDKTKSIRDKAKKLGDDAARKGEGEIAAEYYQIAGLQNEAREIEKRTETRRRQDEGQRQKKFKSDQDKLEKELGL
ncbi:MAG: hypothetical protein OEV31_04705 [Gammaproteobacteria bacterium]|nr:hypothetical protein [Gammaproteobacteria bacterium]